jgi:hypothetical protein
VKLNFRFLQGKYNAIISHGNFSCSSRKHNVIKKRGNSVTLFLIWVGAGEDEKVLQPFRIPRLPLVHLLKIRVWMKEKKHIMFLLLPKHYDMKTCGKMKVHFQAFLTSVLDEYKW